MHVLNVTQIFLAKCAKQTGEVVFHNVFARRGDMLLEDQLDVLVSVIGLVAGLGCRRDE
jgi:ABC-type thiamin/hydroxymethylpyrimidine transport system permease subunit